MPSLACVITTIQPPTPSTHRLAERLRAIDAPLIVVGDKKGPATYDLDGTRLLTLEDQRGLSFQLSKLLPTGHYARKNIGYLAAIATGAGCIYETDDDNAPTAGWSPRDAQVTARELSANRWVNVYRWYTDELIWPRGFPLDQVNDGNPDCIQQAHPTSRFAPIQQGLVDGSPDVDAVWRLVMDKPFRFRTAESVALPSGSWCPFNTQSTWWWPPAYLLLYLPSHCSFRMTDIWRGFVAQRCLWAMGAELVFHAAEVVQDRNEHDLMRDFEHEIPGYLRNNELVCLLEQLPLEDGYDRVGENLLRCYKALVDADFFPIDELELVDAWLADLRQAESGEHTNAPVLSLPAEKTWR